MKFVRLGPIGHEQPAVLTGDGVRSIASLTDDIDAEFWASDGPVRVAAALGDNELPLIADADALRIGAPIARPGAIVAIGMNYAAHAAETGAPPPKSIV